jgi:membrane protein YdbS with pleckstrin-like domain
MSESPTTPEPESNPTTEHAAPPAPLTRAQARAASGGGAQPAAGAQDRPDGGTAAGEQAAATSPAHDGHAADGGVVPGAEAAAEEGTASHEDARVHGAAQDAPAPAGDPAVDFGVSPENATRPGDPVASFGEAASSALDDPAGSPDPGEAPAPAAPAARAAQPSEPAQPGAEASAPAGGDYTGPEAPAVLDEGTYTAIREPRREGGLALDGTWHQISPKYVVSQFVQEGILLVLVIAAAIAAQFFIGEPWPWFPAGAIILITLLSLIILPRQARALGYMLRPDDIVFRKGILWQRMVAVPYGRMQLVDITHGPMDRAFGIAKLKMVTAAATTGVEIPGLGQQAAEGLRDTLIEVAETRRTGL